MNRTVSILTDDCYSRIIPYNPEMENWKVGMLVEVYHETEKWFCEYKIADVIFKVGTNNEICIDRFHFNRTDRRRWWDKEPTQDEMIKELSDAWKKSLMDDIDKSIIDTLERISGKNLNKKTNA